MKRFWSGLLALVLLCRIASLCIPAVQAADPAATEPEIDRAAVAAAYADYVGSAVPFTNFGYFGRYGSTDVLAFTYPSDSTGLQNPAFDDIVPDDEGARLIGRVLGTVTDDTVPSAEDRALYMEASARRTKCRTLYDCLQPAGKPYFYGHFRFFCFGASVFK